MIMCVLLCYPVSIHMSQLLSTGHPISSLVQPLLSEQTEIGRFCLDARNFVECNPFGYNNLESRSLLFEQQNLVGRGHFVFADSSP